MFYLSLLEKWPWIWGGRGRFEWGGEGHRFGKNFWREFCRSWTDKVINKGENFPGKCVKNEDFLWKFLIKSSLEQIFEFFPLNFGDFHQNQQENLLYSPKVSSQSPLYSNSAPRLPKKTKEKLLFLSASDSPKKRVEKKVSRSYEIIINLM